MTNEIAKLKIIGKIMLDELNTFEEILACLLKNRLLEKRDNELYMFMTTPIEDITKLPEINMNTDLDQQIKSLESKVKIINQNYCIVQDRITDLRYERNEHERKYYVMKT